MIYLDASALVKLVLDEPESVALRENIGPDSKVVAAEIAVIEVMRAVRRSGIEGLEQRATSVLEQIDLRSADAGLIRHAAALDPPRLRSLDALHLATALSISDALVGFVCYDQLLASAAEAAGLTVLQPA